MSAGPTTPEGRADEAAALCQLMDQLPIYATRVGYHVESTDEQRALGDALFAVHKTWQSVKPE